MVVTSRWGGDTFAYLGDLSVYHVRLKSGQMISASYKTPIVIVKGYRPAGRRSAFVLGSGQLCGADGLWSKDEYTNLLPSQNPLSCGCRSCK